MPQIVCACAERACWALHTNIQLIYPAHSIVAEKPCLALTILRTVLLHTQSVAVRICGAVNDM